MLTQKFSIAVIDDEDAIREALVTVLKDEGYIVFSAADGEEGLALVIREKPRLILLDITMPKLNGLEMLKQLRSHSEYGDKVQVVLLTNAKTDDTILDAIVKYHPSFFLAKAELTPQDVVEKVKQALK